MNNSKNRMNTKELQNGQKKQVVFVDSGSQTLPAMTTNYRLEKTTIVQNFGSTSDTRNIPFQSPTTKQSKTPSTPQRRLSIRPNDNNTRVNTNTTQRTELSKQQRAIISYSVHNTKENKQEKLDNQKSVLNQSESMNGTITSEFGTIGSNRDTMNDTITSELGTMSSTRSKTNKTELHTNEKEQKIIENQETLDLLDKIRKGAHAVPIGPMPLSLQACRFELPYDLKLLETLTPLDYLSRYCRLTPRRRYQFKRMFDKYRNRRYLFESSCLYLSILDIHKENFTRTKFDYLCQLIDLGDQQYQFTFDIYAGILALCERIIFNSSTLYNDHDDYNLAKDAIEKCDFDSLDRKFDGLVISDAMKRLLNAL